MDRVDLVREGFEAWNSEDPAWILNHMSPEVEWIAPERDPFPGTYKGFEGVQEFWTRWRNAVGQLTFTPEELIDGASTSSSSPTAGPGTRSPGSRSPTRSPRSSASMTRTSASASRSSTTAEPRSGSRDWNDGYQPPPPPPPNPPPPPPLKPPPPPLL